MADEPTNTASKVDVQPGNRPKDYKTTYDAELKQQSAQVKLWRDRIDRAAAILNLRERVETAKQSDEFLSGQKEVKGRKIYGHYLMPLLRERHRQTMPGLPSARCEARSEAAEGYAELARELIDQTFSSPDSNIRDVAEQVQWDDDRSGAGFLKVTFQVDTEPAEFQVVKDDDLAALEVERAQAENSDILHAEVAENDVDYLHLPVHAQQRDELQAMGSFEGEYLALLDHIDMHEARMVAVRRERPRFERVPFFRFVYDCDVPWPDRRWEAERRSILIRDLIEMGCKNVNPENLPAEISETGDSPPAYEDKTAAVFDIHDRHTGKRYYISVDGPSPGLFLWQGKWKYGPVDIYIPFVSEPWLPGQLHGQAVIAAALPICERLAELDFHDDRHIEQHADYKLLMPKGLTTPDVKSGLSNPDQRYVDVPVEAINGIKEKKPPPLPDANLQYRQLLMNDLRRVLGLDAQDVGADHQTDITATESLYRSEQSSGRKAERQERMSEMLSDAALCVLRLYRRMGNLAQTVRVVENGTGTFKRLAPADLPDDLAVFLDIRGESDETRAGEIQAWDMYVEQLKTMPLPAINWQKVAEIGARKRRIQHPELFLSGAPVMPGALPPTPGQPGMAAPESGFSPQPQQTTPQPQVAVQ